ncbi:hypothetical protein ACYUMR_003232 [Providencia stuartii]|uniref:hypothetical protein n=1 Tax=unclassified Providencia TaxID=2633465 RepID=UPI00234917ED|nr:MULTISPECIES: hypothetical protein [unclassified Providencia]HEM8300857.1 hypothetical protein [Providencia stuartii]
MDKSRQQFEEEMAKYLNVSIEFISKERRGDRYYSYSMNFAFDVWQASRESLINNLEPVGYITPVSGLLLRRKQKSFIQPEKTETNIPLYRLD